MTSTEHMPPGSRRTEFWMVALATPGKAAELARVAEGTGWDGVGFADSQNLAADPYVALSAAAHATSDVRLRTSVTNPVTRDVSVTANAIASVHAESGGRAVLGIGRGDSSVAKIGLRAASVEEFDTQLQLLRSYLSGQAVERGDSRSANAWLQDHDSLPRVPIDVAASGPRTIAVAARHADQITFAVGTDVDRLRALVGEARAAATAIGRDASSIRFGAFVNGAAHIDSARACEIARGTVATFARFGAGTDTGRRGQQTAAIARAYDMDGHATASAVDRTVLTDEFVQDFGAIGTSAQCRDALAPVMELGLDHIVIIGPGEDVALDERMACWRRFGEEVVGRMR